MLRFILVAIFLLLYFLLGIPVLGILWLIGKVNKRSADLAALRIVQWGFKVLLKISSVEVQYPRLILTVGGVYND